MASNRAGTDNDKAGSATGDSSSMCGACDVEQLAQQLQRQVDALQSQTQDLVESEVQHLRELALLNRVSDSLAAQREHSAIITDTLTEAERITGSSRLWLIEAPDGGHPGVTHRSHAGVGETPTEAVGLLERIIADPQDIAVSVSLGDGEDVLLGLPIHSPRRLLGVLVGQVGRLMAGSSEVRLLQSLLHQSASAWENALLVESLSDMIVDVVTAMALAIESRDPYTGGHVQRVTAYAVALGNLVGVDAESEAILRLGGLLHDIGKVAVPDRILNKPGRLEDDEFALMKRHPSVGDQIIEPIPRLACVRPVVRHHHERFDGRGYPDGIAGEEIELVARITAIADSFDAMTSTRPYRQAMPIERAMDEIRTGAGTQFDPDLAPLFANQAESWFGAAVESMEQWLEADRSRRQCDLVRFLA